MARNHSDASPRIPPAEARPVIDARGLNCPLPVLKLRKYLQGYTGAVELLATDRAALRDVPAYCRAHGLAVEVLEGADELRFVIEAIIGRR